MLVSVPDYCLGSKWFHLLTMVMFIRKIRWKLIDLFFLYSLYKCNLKFNVKLYRFLSIIFVCVYSSKFLEER